MGQVDENQLSDLINYIVDQKAYSQYKAMLVESMLQSIM